MGEGSKIHNNLKDYTIYLTPIKNKFANKKKNCADPILKMELCNKSKIWDHCKTDKIPTLIKQPTTKS